MGWICSLIGRRKHQSACISVIRSVPKGMPTTAMSMSLLSCIVPRAADPKRITDVNGIRASVRAFLYKRAKESACIEVMVGCNEVIALSFPARWLHWCQLRAAKPIHHLDRKWIAACRGLPLPPPAAPRLLERDFVGVHGGVGNEVRR